MATPITIPSPTMSIASSFEALSSRSRSSTTSSGLTFEDVDSDDEIVWGQSESEGSLDSGLASDDDFVVLNRQRPPRAAPQPAATDGPDTPNNIASHLSSQVSSIVRKQKAAEMRETIARPRSPLSRPASQPQSPVVCATPIVLNRPSSVATMRPMSKGKAIRGCKDLKGDSTGEYPTPSPTPSSQSPSCRPASPLSGGVRLGIQPNKTPSPPPTRNPTPTPPQSPMGVGASKRSAKRRANKKNPSPSPTRSPAPSPPQSPIGLGARSIVDDVSERASECGGEDEIGPGAYDAASSYITSCLSDPSSVCRLTLLQSLIVEFGVVCSSLPESLSKAKAMLKSSVFVNIGEYLDARQRGPAAVQEIIHPSKSSLVRDLRRKRTRRVPRGLVKETGLGVLLVQMYY